MVGSGRGMQWPWSAGGWGLWWQEIEIVCRAVADRLRRLIECTYLSERACCALTAVTYEMSGGRFPGPLDLALSCRGEGLWACTQIAGYSQRLPRNSVVVRIRLSLQTVFHPGSPRALLISGSEGDVVVPGRTMSGVPH